MAVAQRIENDARAVLQHSGETPAALVVIGYATGPTNDRLGKVLGLSHSGTVRLVDRLVASGLVQRGRGADRREVSLTLTARGEAKRDEVLAARHIAIAPFLSALSQDEQARLGDLLAKVLQGLEPDDGERCSICRMCDNDACDPCPIPAAFRDAERIVSNGA